MINSKHTYQKIALVFISAFFLCSDTFAQAFGELLPGSKELTYDAKRGVHKLLGGANFVYQGNTMYSDSALYFEKDKSIRAYGNVQIRRSDNTSLFCDSLHYFSNTGIADLWGNVRATDAEYRLTTSAMTYNTRKEQGVYYNGGKIQNQFKNEVLTSKIGYFHPTSKNFFFRENVKYESDQMRMTTDSLQYRYEKNKVYFFGETCIVTDSAILEGEKGWYDLATEDGSLMKNAVIEQQSRIISGDSLIYSSKKKVAEGFCNVFVKDTAENMAFSANYAYMNDSLKYSLLTDDALIIKYHQKDTLYIHADTLYNKNDSLNNRLLTLGYHNVKIFSSSIQGMGDSLSFAKENGYLELYKKPMLWAKNGELKGDSMRVYMDDSLVYEAQIKGKSSAIMQVDSIGYYNQVGGNEMFAYFKNNEVHTAKVIGNAQTIFYPTEERKQAKQELDSLKMDSTKMKDTLSIASDSLIVKGEENLIVKDSTKLLSSTDSVIVVKRMGLNRFYASEIKVYFDSGEVVGVTYYDKPDGIFFPMDQIDEKEKFIQHFSTNFALRPKSVEDLLNE